jgi:hypothetical protein
MNIVKFYCGFFRGIIRHVRHARLKHPLFAKRVLWRDDALFNHNEAKWQKKQIERNHSLEAVLLSEVHEFLVEMHKKNYKRAFEEALDIVAVLVRALLGDIGKGGAE